MANFLIIEPDDCFGLPVKASTAGRDFKAWEKSMRVLNQTDFRHLGPNSDTVLKLFRLSFTVLPLNGEPQTEPSWLKCSGKGTLAELLNYYLRCSLFPIFPIKSPFSPARSPFQTTSRLVLELEPVCLERTFH